MNIEGFQNLISCGFISWDMNGVRKPLKNASCSDILDRLGTEHPPKIQVPDTTEVFFQDLRPQRLRIKDFPSQPGHTPVISSLTQLNIDMKDIDFIFGGSTLNMLATRSIDKDTEYIAQRITDGPLVITKLKDYVQNFSNIGFQFEKFVTGRSMLEPDRKIRTESVHIMNVNGYKILFAAECDAVDENHAPVEIKTQTNAGTKLMWQLISSNSSKVIYGHVSRGKIIDITSMSISEIIDKNRGKLDSHVTNINTALEKLAGANGNFAISFVKNETVLTPCDKHTFAPSALELVR